MRNIELSEALFDAFSSGDEEAARALVDQELTAVQNYGPPMKLDELLAFSTAVNQVVKGFRYEDAIRTETETGFIEEHRVCGELPDGNQLNLAACVVGTVEDGKIIALREYVDTGAAIGLLKALQ